MSIQDRLTGAAKDALPRSSLAQLKLLRERLQLPIAHREGLRFARDLDDKTAEPTTPQTESNPLRDYFEAHNSGPGIWKWEHYFDIYHRHLQKFVGTDAKIVEIGIYSGGSLPMWHDYFGPKSHIYGIDIEPACKAYASDQTTVVIGDQADREFWRSFSAEHGVMDVVIDDGGHEPHQQIASLEEMLPQLRPGGVYICEDVTGSSNRFRAHVNGIVDELNRMDWDLATDKDKELLVHPSPTQQLCTSVHFYPYVVVIERAVVAPNRLRAPKHGTEWQPFFE